MSCEEAGEYEEQAAPTCPTIEEIEAEILFGDQDPPEDATCPHCGKEYEDFSDYGCEHCDGRI